MGGMEARVTLRHAKVLSLVLLISWAGCGRRESPAEPPASISLHDELTVVDGHVHMINSVFHQGIDPWSVQSIGSFDYARAKQGGLDVAVEHLYIEDAYNKYNYTIKQALRLIETFYGVIEANTGRMELALTSQDVRRIAAQGKLAVIWPSKVVSIWKETRTCFGCSTVWVSAWFSSRITTPPTP